jgi:hypothetical protein
MPRPSILVTDIIDRAAEETIGAGLRKFNEEQSRISDLRRLAVILQDPESQETLGGAIGRTSLGLLFHDLFFVPQTLRGVGLGTQILRLFEDEGRRAAAARRCSTRSVSRRRNFMRATDGPSSAKSPAIRPEPAASS